MPKEHIFANLQTVLMDVCSHRPANMGTFPTTTRHHSTQVQPPTYNSFRAAPLPSTAAEELCLTLLTALQDKTARIVNRFLFAKTAVREKILSKRASFYLLAGSVYCAVARLMEKTDRRSATRQPSVLCDFSKMRASGPVTAPVVTGSEKTLSRLNTISSCFRPDLAGKKR